MSETRDAIEAALTTFVAPLVARDGGSIRLLDVVDDTATVALEGACAGCPARPITRDLVIVPLLAKELGRPIAVELD